MDILTNLIVVIISQYICISNHHIVYLKLNVVCQLYLSKAGKKIKDGNMFIFLMGMTYCKQRCGSLGLEILQEISLMSNEYSMEKLQNIIKFEKYFESCLQFHAK